MVSTRIRFNGYWSTLSIIQIYVCIFQWTKTGTLLPWYNRSVSLLTEIFLIFFRRNSFLSTILNSFIKSMKTVYGCNLTHCKNIIHRWTTWRKKCSSYFSSRRSFWIQYLVFHFKWEQKHRCFFRIVQLLFTRLSTYRRDDTKASSLYLQTGSLHNKP